MPAYFMGIGTIKMHVKKFKPIVRPIIVRFGAIQQHHVPLTGIEGESPILYVEQPIPHKDD